MIEHCDGWCHVWSWIKLIYDLSAAQAIVTVGGLFSIYFTLGRLIRSVRR